MKWTLDFLALSPEELLALVVATSFAAGLNIYATVATLGLLARTGVVTLPPALGLLDNWWVIGASGVLYWAPVEQRALVWFGTRKN